MQGIGKVERVGRDERRVFAQRVPGHIERLQARPGRRQALMQGLQASHADGQDGRLRVDGILQLLLGPSEAKLGDGEAQEAVGLVKDGPAGRRRLVDITAHAHEL